MFAVDVCEVPPDTTFCKALAQHAVIHPQHASESTGGSSHNPLTLGSPFPLPQAVPETWTPPGHHL